MVFMSTDLDSRHGGKDTNSSDFSSGQWLGLSLGSAAVYLAFSYLIFYFFHESGLLAVFNPGLPMGGQLAIGSISGVLAAAAVWFIMSRPPVSGVLDDFYIVKMISRTRLTFFDRLQISLLAGAGEELLFRGAIQPLLGIWITSVIFVGLHGYFKFKSPGHIILGVMMFGLSAGLGYLFEQAGLFAAMSAHAVYDMILLRAVWSVRAR